MLEEKHRQKQKVDGLDYHCIHCDEDPSCVFMHIELHPCENDTLYYNEGEHTKDPVTHNSTRYKYAFQYTAYILCWEGSTPTASHTSTSVQFAEDGVGALFPPFDGKIMGYKKKIFCFLTLC